MFRDVRFGARTLRRNPSFAVAAILTLALGIGANTAIFSLIDEILLRPFPLPHPEQLAQVYSFDRKTGSFVSGSYPDYQDFRRRSLSFRQIAAYVRLPLDVTFGGHVERISVEAVTDNYFAMLELPPLAGRTIDTEDESAGAPVAMIGETLWRQRFGGDAGVIGKDIAIEDHRFTIVGVVPKRFRGTNLNWDDPPELWIPLHSCPLVEPGFAAADIFHRRLPWLVVTGRLQPAVTVSAGAGGTGNHRGRYCARPVSQPVSHQPRPDRESVRLESFEILAGIPRFAHAFAGRICGRGRSGAAIGLRQCIQSAASAGVEAAARICGPAGHRRRQIGVGTPVDGREPAAAGNPRFRLCAGGGAGALRRCCCTFLALSGSLWLSTYRSKDASSSSRSLSRWQPLCSSDWFRRSRPRGRKFGLR